MQNNDPTLSNLFWPNLSAYTTKHDELNKSLKPMTIK